MRTTILGVFLLAAGAALSGGALTACGGDECSSNTDCPADQICRLGLCVRDLGGTDGLINPDGADIVLSCDPAALGDLVLNEILADPPPGADVNGDGVASTSGDEFVEVVNVSGKTVGLANVQIDVSGKKAALGMICLGPNEARVLFGAQGLPGLTNSGSTVTLLIDGLTAQTHTYGSEGGKDTSMTLAIQLDPTSSWVLHNTVSSLPYSPGKCSDGSDFPNCGTGPPVEGGDADVAGDTTLECDPAGASDLVLNEILADPPPGADVNGDGVASATGDEFVEVVNVASKAVALTNVELEVGGRKVGLGAMCLGVNGARVLFGADGLPGLTNSGSTVSLLVDGAVVQTHTYGAEGGKDESLTLATQLDPTSGWVGHKSVGGGAAYSPGKCSNGNDFPDCFSAPVEPMPDTVDGTDGGDVADTSVDDTLAPDDGGPVCGPPAGVGDLVINEIMADPGTTLDWNGDGTPSATQDEFVEILNLAPYTVSLSGVTLSDKVGVKYTAGTRGDDCLGPDEALVVFGGGTPNLAVTGAIVVAGGSLSLNNTDETVTLKSAAGDTMDSYAYTTATKETSFVRSPDGTGTSFVLHPEISATGRKGSPGTCLDGGAFPGCLTP